MARIQSSPLLPSSSEVPAESPTAAAAAPPRSASAANQTVTAAFDDDVIVAPRREGPAPTASQVLPQLDALLVRRAGDLRITPEDTNRALQLLETLPSKELDKALHKLERSGGLSNFVSNASPASRDALLELCATRGLLGKDFGVEPYARFDPPRSPDTYCVPRGRDVPDSLREAMGDHSHQEWSRYESQYGDYLDRYGAAVWAAGTPSELRKLGPPTDAASTSGRLISNLRAHKEVYAKVLALRGELGSGAAITASQEVKAGPLKQVQSLRTDGLGSQSKLERSVEFKAGPAIVELAPNKPLSVELEAKGRVVGAKAGLKSDGEFNVEAQLGLLSARNAVAGDGAKVDIGVCVATYEDPSGGSEMKLCLDVELRGMSPEAARESADVSTGFFEHPRELNDGRSWSSLTPARRRSLEYRGWSSAEWNQVLADRRN